MLQCRLWGNQVALAELYLFLFDISADLSSILPVGVVWDQDSNGFIRVKCLMQRVDNFLKFGKPGKNGIDIRSARSDILNIGEVIRKTW